MCTRRIFFLSVFVPIEFFNVHFLKISFFFLLFFILISAGSSVNLVGNFDFDTYKVIEYKSTLNMQCNLTDESVADIYTIDWLKNDKSLAKTTDERVEFQPSENRMILSKALDTDAGNYTCVFTHKKNASELRLNFQVVCKYSHNKKK